MKSMIIFCNCSWSDVIDEKVKERILEYLKNSGHSLCVVDDLCRIAVKDKILIADRANAGRLTIVACFPRTIKWLFEVAGVALAPDTTVLNMRGLSADQIISKLGEIAVSDKPVSDGQIEKQGDWNPWFPVVDYDRCVNCRQCLNFCLFGVYALDKNKKVEVRRPANCKTNCPACARVCPQAAIIFPKYHDSPINGDQVDEEALMKADKSRALADLMDGDIHEIIRSRSAKRKRFAPKSAAELPDSEKASKLDKLKNQLDIPQEVIDSLSNENQAKNNQCKNSAFCSKKCPENQSQ